MPCFETRDLDFNFLRSREPPVALAKVGKRGQLTDGDSFFEIMKEHAARFADGTARTADFIDVAEEISGHDLGDLFTQWLFERSVPEFPAGT